jgi:hypothetical protein
MAKQYEALEDKYEEYLREFSDCKFCKHYLGDGTCDAFPNGIPPDIASGEFNHHVPYDKNNEIIFEIDLKKVRERDKQFEKFKSKFEE